MKELITTSRGLHHLIFIVSVALLPFALTPDEFGRLTKAIEELRYWEKYSHPGWIKAVNEARDQVGRDWIKDGFDSAVSKGWEKDKTRVVTDFPVISNMPSDDAPLAQHRDWAIGFNTGDKRTPAWQSFVDILVPNFGRSGAGDVSQHLEINWKQWDGTIEWVKFDLKTDAPRLNRTLEVRGLNMPDIFPPGTKVSNFKLRGSVEVKQGNETPSFDFDADEPVSSMTGVHIAAPVDVLTPEAKKILLPGNGDRSRLLPNVLYFWEDVRDKSTKEAYAFLKEKRRQVAEKVEVAGVKVDLSQLAFAGPIALLVLAAYLYTYVSRGLLLGGIKVDRDTTCIWGALFPGRLSTFVTLLTLVVIPTAVTLLLCTRMASPSVWERVWAVTITVFVGALGTAISAAVFRFRRLIAVAPLTDRQ